MPTFSVVAEAHLGLGKTNCVFSRANAIEFLQLRLRDTLLQQRMISKSQKISRHGETLRAYLVWEVDFNGLDADVLGARRHGGRR